MTGPSLTGVIAGNSEYLPAHENLLLGGEPHWSWVTRLAPRGPEQAV